MKWVTALLSFVILALSCTKHHTEPPAGPVYFPPTRRDTPATVNISPTWVALPYSTFRVVNDLFFISPAEGFLVSWTDTTVIYHSVDSGYSWNAIPLGFGGKWLYMQFTDKLHGYILGYRSMGVSSDGGTNWTLRPLPTRAGHNFQFTSPEVGYYCDFFHGIFQTKDAAQTWTKRFAYPDSTGRHSFLCFPSPAHGFLVVDNEGFYNSVDSGKTWSLVSRSLPNIKDPTAHFPYAPDLGNQIQFLNDETGYYARFDGVFKTTDGGHTWTWVLPVTNTDASEIHFFDEDHGYYANRRDLLETTDGGATWEQIWPYNADYLVALNFFDEEHGWLGTGTGRVVRKYK